MNTVKELKAALIGDLEDSGESPIGEAEAKLDAFAAAVISEASVGVVSTYTTLRGPDGWENIDTDWTIEGNMPEDGTFYLVPKVKP